MVAIGKRKRIADRKTMTRKVIVRIKGGLGNQLFCYAAARRLALVQDAELVLDHVTGFSRDYQYQRMYGLDRFNITARKASCAERLEPFERFRRRLIRETARRMPFEKRIYLEQEGAGFDPRLLSYQVRGTVYLDGYWQSEKYFKDIEPVLRQDLIIKPPDDILNRQMAEQILNCNAVAIHVRWFQRASVKTAPSDHGNLALDYYRRALQEIRVRVIHPHFFIFSDDPIAGAQWLGLSEDSTCVYHNQGEQNAYADLWLMTHCKHFIIANSTFSWWGAWLSDSPGKMVIAPGKTFVNPTTWDFDGLFPETWIVI